MRRVHVHIERVTLAGVAGVDGAAVGVAIRRELGKLLASGDSLRSTSVDRVDGGTLTVPAPATSYQVGRAVSASVHRSIRRTAKP